MQCVILAAGRGVRMRDLTNDTPKPLLKINGKSILEYTLDNLPEEISEVIFIIGYRGDLIRARFGDEYKGKKIKYILQEDLNGGAAGLHLAGEFLGEKFLVLNGDDLYQKSDLEKLIKNKPPAFLGKEIDRPGRFGVCKVDNKGFLIEIIEAGMLRDENTKLVNCGAYFLNKNFFNYPMIKKSSNPGEKEFGLPQTLATMAKDYRIKVEKAQFWHPIGYPEDILKAEIIIGENGKGF